MVNDYNSPTLNSNTIIDSSDLIANNSLFLKKERFLSEFRTLIEKARARKNLGITDAEWGLILGDITNLKDLIDYIETHGGNLEEIFISDGVEPDKPSYKFWIDESIDSEGDVTPNPSINDAQVIQTDTLEPGSLATANVLVNGNSLQFSFGIPKGENGLKGEDGISPNTSFKSIVFCRTNKTPSKPNNGDGSYSLPVPQDTYYIGDEIIKWTDGIPNGNKLLWSTTRIFSSDGLEPQLDSWTEPKPLTDTANFDVEFSSELNPSTPNGHPNTNPQWSNTANENIIWMATSTMNNGEWSAWQVSKIKGENGKDGLTPITSFVSLIFCRTNTQPATPQGGSYENPSKVTDPSGLVTWTDGIPSASEEILWVSTRTFFSDNSNPEPWSKPSKVTDTADFDVEFSADIIPGNPTSNPEKWSNKATPETLFMATRVKSNGVWSSWQVVKIKGEKGDDGASIRIKGKFSNRQELNSIQGALLNDAYVYSGKELDISIEPYLYPGHLYIWNGSDSWIDVGQFKGEDGVSLYIHIKYAHKNELNHYVLSTNNGEDPDDYIGIYYDENPGVDRNIEDPVTGTPYTFSYIKGKDGFGYEYIYTWTSSYQAPNVPQVNIESPEYLKPDYVPSGDNWSDDPWDISENKPYIWVCYRKFTNGKWGKYIGSKNSKGLKCALWARWSKDGLNGKDGLQGPIGETGPTGPKGELGIQGLRGLQGEHGELGIQGPKGDDGQSLYFHIKYSKNKNGNPMTETPSTYIGTRVDNNPIDSTNYTDYTWSRFEGQQGLQGIPGVGLDGKTSYLHIKYSNDGGKSFTNSNGETPGDWIGQYVDFEKNDSNDPKKYTWSKIKGDKGPGGLIIYPAGIWDSTTTYRANDKNAPYVWDDVDRNYFVLNVVNKNVIGTAPHEDLVNWVKFEHFDTIYADIGIFGNALVGLAVFNGNYMFSQTGKDLNILYKAGETSGWSASDSFILESDLIAKGWSKEFPSTGGKIWYTKPLITKPFPGYWNNPLITKEKITANSYHLFDKLDPFGTSSIFNPNVCFNFKTGEAWFNGGETHIKQDGSGYFAMGNLSWNEQGNINVANGDFRGNIRLGEEKTVLNSNGNVRFGNINTPRVEIINGEILVYGKLGKNGENKDPNIRIGVNAEGLAVLSYFDKTGKFLYDLGPEGIRNIDVASFNPPITLALINDSALLDTLTWEGVKNTIKNPGNGSNWYRYNAGTGPSNNMIQADGKLYNSNKFTSTTLDKLPAGTVIPNGWYTRNVGKATMELPQGTPIPTGPTIIKEPDIIENDISGTYRVCFRTIDRYNNGKYQNSMTVYFNNDISVNNPKYKQYQLMNE